MSSCSLSPKDDVLSSGPVGQFCIVRIRNQHAVEQSLPAYFGPAARLLRCKSRAGVRNPLKRGVGA
jgi:hypothetical protein